MPELTDFAYALAEDVGTDGDLVGDSHVVPHRLGGRCRGFLTCKYNLLEQSNCRDTYIDGDKVRQLQPETKLSVQNIVLICRQN